MNLYLVRHGQSIANKKGRRQGSNGPLSKMGIRQARDTAKRFKNIPIDIIYSSPFKRTEQTAEIIARKLNLPIEYWEDLRERKRPSSLVGLSVEDPLALDIENEIKMHRHKRDYRYSDDESYNDLMKRAKSVVDHLLNNHYDQNVLCVSHGGFIKFIVAYLIFGQKLSPKFFWEFYYHTYLANSGITHIEYTDKYGWGLITWNDMTHL